MDTKKLVVVECLYKDDVACCDENGVTCLYEVVVPFFDNNNRDGFDVDFFLAHLLE